MQTDKEMITAIWPDDGDLCRQAHKIIVADGITTIPKYAFGRNTFETKIEELVMPDTVTDIQGALFTEINVGELKKVTLSRNIKHLPDKLFYGARCLCEINLPDKLESIGESAFECCFELKQIDIPKHVKSIQDNAFTSCHGLKEVTMTDSVKYIGRDAFMSCHSLEKITLSKNIKCINDRLLSNCWSLKEIIIPANVTKIEHSAFHGCRSLEKINLPKNLKIIEDSTFADCHKLQSITIPDSVQKIEKWAFIQCDSLSEVHLPSCLDYIGDSAFYDCDSLKNLTIPYGTTTIDHSAFCGCSALETIVIPASVRKLNTNILNAADFKEIIFQDVTIPQPLCSKSVIQAFHHSGYTDNFIILTILKYCAMYNTSLTPFAASRFSSAVHARRIESDHKDLENVLKKMVKEYLVTGLLCPKKHTSSVKTALEKQFREKFHGHVPEIIDAIAIAASNIPVPVERFVEKFNVKAMRYVLKQQVSPVPLCILYAMMDDTSMLYQLDTDTIMKSAYCIMTLQSRRSAKANVKNMTKFANWFIKHPNTHGDKVSAILDALDELDLQPETSLHDIKQQWDIKRCSSDLEKVEDAYESVGFKFANCKFDLKFSTSTCGNYTASIMQPGDIRMFSLGYYTSCCQHLNGEGESAMMHGLLHPNAGFWIIEDHTTKQIIAQAEIWELDPDTIVFDNIEYADKRDISHVRDITGLWCKESPYATILVGTGYNKHLQHIVKTRKGVKPKLTAEEIYMLDDTGDMTKMRAEELYESGRYKYSDYVYTDADKTCMIFKNKGVLDPYFRTVQKKENE